MGTMHKNVIYTSIKSLCDAHSPPISFSKMCVDLGLSKSLGTKLKDNPDKEINSETAQKIADYFGVSVDRVLGTEQNKPPTSQTTDERITFDDFTYAMQNETKDLTEMDKQLLLSMAKQLNDARKQRNGEHK